MFDCFYKCQQGYQIYERIKKLVFLTNADKESVDSVLSTIAGFSTVLMCTTECVFCTNGGFRLEYILIQRRGKE